MTAAGDPGTDRQGPERLQTRVLKCEDPRHPESNVWWTEIFLNQWKDFTVKMVDLSFSNESMKLKTFSRKYLFMRKYCSHVVIVVMSSMEYQSKFGLIKIRTY